MWILKLVPLFCSSRQVSPALMCLCCDGWRAKAPSSPPWWASSPPAASAARSRPPLSAAAPPMGAEHLPGPRPHSQCPSLQRQRAARRTSWWRSRTSSASPPSSCSSRLAPPGRCQPRALSAAPAPGRWDETQPSQMFWTVLLASVLSHGSSLIHLPALPRLWRTGSPEWCQAGWDSQTGRRKRAHPSGCFKTFYIA